MIGHQKIVDFLKNSVRLNRLAHAYLFAGPPQVGKKTVAFEFAKKLLCRSLKESGSACGQCESCHWIEQGQHPDLFFIDSIVVRPDSKRSDKEAIKSLEVKIEKIRQIQRYISLSPFSSQYKIVIIDSADLMTKEAASCLLKTLEEPPPKSLLILISAASQKLIPTITSRCQILKFFPVRHDLIAEGLKGLGFKDDRKINQAVRCSGGRPGAAIGLLAEKDALEEKIKTAKEIEKIAQAGLAEKFKYAQNLAQNAPLADLVLADWIAWLRDQLLAQGGVSSLAIFGGSASVKFSSLAEISNLIKKIQETQNLLGDNSLSARLILENLMLKI